MIWTFTYDTRSGFELVPLRKSAAAMSSSQAFLDPWDVPFWILRPYRLRLMYPYTTTSEEQRARAQCFYKTGSDFVDFDDWCDQPHRRSLSAPPTPLAVRSGWNVYRSGHMPPTLLAAVAPPAIDNEMLSFEFRLRRPPGTHGPPGRWRNS